MKDDTQTIHFDAELIRRYDRAGPRYTSYPTAVQFHEGFGETEYRAAAARSNTQGRALSLYFHLPFCNTVCYYCACNKIVTKDRSRAAPYLARLHREIALQAELFDADRQVEQLHWGGGTPTFLSHAEMTALMRATREHFTLVEDGEYSIEVDPREAGPGTIELLGELGFNRLSLGVQDFDERVQRAVNRIQGEAETLGVIERARASGFRSVSVDLIYGLPFQSVASFAATVDRIVAAGPDRVSVFNYAHLPERFKPQRRIAAEDLPSPAEKLAILEDTIDRLTAAGYVYIGMDHFARPDDELAVAQRAGTLYRNFQGYSTHAECDLVAMGVTAIGSLGDVYAQNVRTEAEYFARLDDDRLAVFRGVALSEDDRLRRAVISALICHFRLDYAAIESAFGIVFADYFAAELAALADLRDDGLLDLNSGGITVTPAGRLLIRNICMVFDAYLQQGAGSYSKVI
ncbi:oxygen-independent coproporphyrinogen III oxidase [Acidihalobacter aeolianus]|uniref:Coproporphyrinogen-III oxidase n=1 Tax=Acidihalobacter aeolianus TaxID=2792603 RepID=A0A1D8KCD5_9GAMM|nr:oxygen-independent coproporphyrinogen III oxidase [Acidihalobacter aeolianus]AOV18597.1 oxygen-independent coproporphyrinogen III oxidase [Acidihalobacter aeolianus]